jgi:hypothetical protein
MAPKILFAALILSCCFSSCKDEELDSQLFGTWNVTRVEGQQYVNGVAGLQLADPSPSGYVRFDSDGTGEQNYYFTLFGTVYPNISEFSWEADDSEIRIDRFTEPDMVWRRTTTEPNRQVATYNIVVNDSQNWDYTLTLER